MGRTSEDETSWSRIFNTDSLRRLHKILRGES